MIRYAKFSDISILKQLWKICFNDKEDYINLFFFQKFSINNTLVFENDKGKILASLYIQNYTITVYSYILPISYFCGIATFPEYRNKGIASQLITYAEMICKKANIPIVALIPANIYLFPYYEKLGYTQVFDEEYTPILLNDIYKRTPNLFLAYLSFNDIYAKKNYCIQKSYRDFRAIIAEWTLSKYENKYNCWGMAKILNYAFCINILESNIANLTFNLSYYLNIPNDDCNDVSRVKLTKEQEHLFCRLFFGYHINDLKEEKFKIFPQQTPIINLMLE